MIEGWRQAVEPVGSFARAKLFLPVLLLGLFWCWETRRPFFDRRSGRLRHGSRNVAIALLNTTVLAFTFGMVTAIVADRTEQHCLTSSPCLSAFGWPVPFSCGFASTGRTSGRSVEHETRAIRPVGVLNSKTKRDV